MAKSSPITGPYPDGDARNITLAKSDNPIEPPRTGPAEDASREDDAAASANAHEGAKSARSGASTRDLEARSALNTKSKGETADGATTGTSANANRRSGD